MQIWRSLDGSEIGVVAATWELNPKVTFDSLADEFKRNPTKAWRNYGSVILSSTNAALKEPETVIQRVNATRLNPWDLRLNQYADWFVPRPAVRYFMHFDLARNRDAVGIAVAHRDRTSDRMVLDFLHQHRPRAGANVDFAELRERYIYPLVSRGFLLECVSYDGFASDETRQILEARGIRTELCSADKTTDAYDTLIELLLSDRLDYYNHAVFITEMEELELVGGKKYDHPRRFRNGQMGSKDVADAAACAVLMAVRYERDHPVDESPGVLRVITSPHLAIPRFGERTPWG